MADTIYNILVNYELETKGAEEGLDRLKEGFERLKQVAEFALVGLGIEKLIDKTIELGSEVENTRIKLAGMMNAAQAPGAESFNDALQLSGALIEEIRERSKTLPGTWQDLARIVNTITVPGLNAGQSMSELTDLASKAQALFLPQGSDSGQISHSLRAMLNGHARGMDPIFQQLQSVMPSGVGESFNKLTNVERYEAIVGALKKFDPAMKEFEHSWIAVSTTTKNWLELIGEEGSGKLFEGLKSSLASINDWISANRATIMGYAGIIGDAFSGIFGMVLGLVKLVGPPLLAMFSGIFSVVMYVFDLFSRLIKPVAEVIAYLVLPNAATSSWITFGNLVGWLISMFLLWQGILIGVTVVTKAYEAAVWLMNAAVAANPFGLMAVAVLGVVAGLALAIAYIKELRLAFETMMDSKLTRNLLKKAGVIPQNATDADMDDAISGGRVREANGLRPITDVMGHLKDTFGGLNLQALLPGALSFPGKEAGIDDRLKKMLEQKGVVKQGNTNINVKIEQQIDTNDDPERILIKTKEALEQALLHPIETASNRFGTLR